MTDLIGDLQICLVAELGEFGYNVVHSDAAPKRSPDLGGLRRATELVLLAP